MLGTVGANAVTNVKYDKHGNTTEYTVADSTTHLSWDTVARNLGVKSVGADPADLVLDTNKQLLTRSILLPGGVLLTIKGDDRSYDQPSVRGDLSLTTGKTCAQVGALRTFTPFGEPLTTEGTVDPDNVPDNMPGQMDNGWLGQHQRLYEHAGALAIVQMGARPYSPLLGRFLSVDPVVGGSANDYDYANGNPINELDLDGKCSWSPFSWGKCIRKAAGAAKRFYHRNEDTIRLIGKVGAYVAGAVGVAACGVSVVCGIAVGVAAGFAGYASTNAGKSSWSWKEAAVDTGLGAIGGRGSVWGIRRLNAAAPGRHANVAKHAKKGPYVVYRNHKWGQKNWHRRWW
ncbi:RHS repeat-associated core domain-containing protein [Lentzea sp. NPDC102401]|uniref:RHS repeat-associated core domain-containing protein n=1 Tax=Lentzea sp. NPDC102401 TaxID=3364128 RepID=UPI00381BF30D